MSIRMSFLSLILIPILTVMLCFGMPASTVQAMPLDLTLTVLPGLKGVFTGSRPPNLGVKDGKLSPCPASPNCVVSQSADPDHAIAPLVYTTDRAKAQALLLAVLKNQPRTEVIEHTTDYILVEFTSRLMGFVDDAEFYFPADEKVIHLRSAARLGESDLGVNRRRIEQFRLALQSLGA
jgi:uncharacterized protein (DUF1499 family)